MIINSIFNSIDGECNNWGQGTFSTFIRFAGCNFSIEGTPCSYCDTPDAQEKDAGQDMTYYEILKVVEKYGCKKITITGGEPLMQNDFRTLLSALVTRNYQISVETNGSFSILNYFKWYKDLCWIVDYKLQFPEKMVTEAFIFLTEKDFVKFVIADIIDLWNAVEVKKELVKQGCRARFFFSPLKGGIDVKTLIKTIQEHKLFDWSLNFQIHKFLKIA
jgi:7-carboxy-7-deazaguanine synthase